MNATATASSIQHHNNDETNSFLAACSQDIEEAESSVVFVFPELSQVLNNSTSSTMMMQQGEQQSHHHHYRHSGVLWKRRDVFKNRWRPRWFSLNPEQGVLTYYLLSTPLPTADSMATTAPMTDASQMSAVSENSLDYDVVPRGTIFLLGCTVVSNDVLSKPSEHLYTFSIRPPETSGSGGSAVVVHLAARTAAARTVWVQQMTRVITEQRQPPRRLHSAPLLTPAQRIIPEDDENEDTHEEEDTTTTTAPFPPPWEPIPSAQPFLYEHLSTEVTESIQSKLHEYLPCCCEEYATHHHAEWKSMFHTPRDNDAKAFQKINTDGRVLVQSHRTLPYRPLQVLRAVLDIHHRHLYETNLQTNERIQVLNDHTFVDFYAYRGIWPTSPREFAVLSHWQVMSRHNKSGEDDNESAVVLLNFSCPLADKARPITPGQVRGQLIVSLIVLRPHDTNECRMTRLLGVDLGGGLSPQISNIVASQQAGLPGILQEFMKKTVSDDDDNETDDTTTISREHIVATIIPRLARTSTAHDEETNGNNDTSHSNAEPPDMTVVLDDTDDDEYDDDVLPTGPSVEWQAIYLLAPVLLHKCWGLCCTAPGSSSALFVFMVYICIRQLVLLHVIGHASSRATSKNALFVDHVTSRLTVEPKGILRFVANKREERQELCGSSTLAQEVKAIHVVVAAVAKALAPQQRLRRRRVHMPWLCIDQVVDSSHDPIVISVVASDGTIETIRGAEKLKIEQIAQGMTTTTTMGDCVILPFVHDDEPGPLVRVDAFSAHPTVTSVISVTGLPNNDDKQQQQNALPFFHNGQTPRQQVAVSFFVRGVEPTFPFCVPPLVREVQKLLQFPEMCDDE